MAQRQFVPLGEEDAPAEWTIPPRLQMQVEQAEAVFDGTNASGDFLPVLTVISDSGHEVGTYVGEQVAAGGSAKVSWFPRGRVGRSAASGGDYVFISETVLANTGDPLGFSAIPQGFRHLVVECLIGPDGTETFIGMTIGWNNTPAAYCWAGLLIWDNSGTPTESPADGIDDTSISLNSFAAGVGNPDIPFAVASLKFPYYSVPNTAHTVIGQAGGLTGSESPSYAATAGVSIYNSGTVDPNPITSIQLAPQPTLGLDPFVAGSRASLYGIT